MDYIFLEEEATFFLWTLWERERVGRFGRMALKHVYYHVWNESPVQVRCTILDAWGWCTGMTQRDGMGREEGGGFRMGNTWIPVADSFRYLAKPIQYCKVKKKKRSNILWFPVESGQCQCSLTSSLRQSCSVYSKRSHSLKVSIQIWSLKLRTTNEIFWGIPRYHRIHLFFSSEWLYQGEGF